MAKFLITGGAGFIGSNIAEKLVALGHFVRIFDDFSSGRESNLSFAQALSKDKFEIYRGSIASKEDCDRACQGMDYVIHQAALKSVPKSLLDPENYNNVNINGTLFLLQACLKHKVKRFVFASSSSVYGDSNLFPQKEDHLPKPISPYALTKIAGEYYCKIFTTIYGLETVCLRYFNVFGPKQPPDDEYSAVIPKFISLMLNGEQPTIFGDGKQSRDFTYIDNVVQANILAATTKGLKHEVMNAAIGGEFTVIGIVDGVNKILNTQIKPIFSPPRAGDIYRSFSDSSKIRQLTGYNPTVTFDEGLKHTVEYLKKMKS